MFKPEWVREDVGQIQTTIPVMHTIKSDIENYLKANPALDASGFSEWLGARCKELSLTKLSLQPLADEFEEADSRRKGRSVPPENFGCRNLPLVFKRERLLKRYVNRLSRSTSVQIEQPKRE